ncbi:response regulator [Vallitalea guaymasensis]|uniref:response regulator n=1 Tax=Vallitalea guaymasensis TaxID=1185412 RepID=UPI0023529A68|nr:response regulator [Vallitalea guaymasensis]
MHNTILKTTKVLYVEDEKITRTYIHNFLKKKVGKVILAENGEDGIQKFVENIPDIIITDLVLPDISGIEMMRRIRLMGYKSPVIITSASSDSKTILETIDLKIEKYILKPIDVNILMEKLKEIVSGIIESNNEQLVVNQEHLLSDEQKIKFQIDIRNIYSKYLKSITGKGARSIQVFIKHKEIEIVCKDNLTIIEESLMNAGQYSSGIQMIRHTIYENTINDVEQGISELIGKNVNLKKIDLYPKRRYERILFEII